MSQKTQEFCVCGCEHFHLSFDTFWDWFSGHGGKKNFVFFLIHTNWDISFFVPVINLSYNLVLSTAECYTLMWLPAERLDKPPVDLNIFETSSA
jgi:hypothetical protein